MVGVTFSDGTEGVIEAASKISQPNKDDPAEFTSCSYYTSDYRTYPGKFQSDEFFSDEAPEVKQFCLDDFANRE
jgi:hypothetical protein